MCELAAYYLSRICRLGVSCRSEMETEECCSAAEQRLLHWPQLFGIYTRYAGQIDKERGSVA